jgi:uncharacterized protein involved in exopolysaccharide biosynthesis
MTTQDDSGERAAQLRESHAEREVIYVAPSGLSPGYDDDRISLRELWQKLWQGKLTVFAITALFAVGSVTYALLATEIYRSEVLVTPAEDQSMPMLLVDDPADAPDIRDAIKYFQENVLKVSEERTTGLVTIAVEWTDPDVAATWADVLVRRLNDRLRERALEEAEQNVAYLREEMAKSSLVTMQQSIGQLLQSELQKLMLARGNEEFAFKVVDPAIAPKQRTRPKRSIIAIIGTFLGGLVGAFVVLVAQSARSSSSA